MTAQAQGMSGQRLKQIRLQKGISLEEVYKKTKIHLNILKAIEGDNLTNLNPIYLRGFLKVCGKFLGVEPKDYIPDYKETGGWFGIEKTPLVTAKSEKLSVLLRSVSEAIGSLSSNKKLKKILVTILAVSASALVLINLGRIISSKLKTSTPAKTRLALEKGRIKETKETTVVSAKSKPRSQTQPITPSAANIRLGIRTREDCWVKLKVDGRVVFRGVLEKGRFETWQAKEKMELSLGNAGGVQLEVNGQVFSNLGRRHQALKDIVITKKGLTIRR